MSRLVIEDLRPVCGGPFSFAVESGECAVLSGPSGCGKTLLLRALADLDPASGSIFLDGAERSTMVAPVWRKQVGWLPAEASWWFDGVGDHFDRQKSKVKGRTSGGVASTLGELGFGMDVLDWRVDRLSTGEKQRLGLFRLLLNEPKVLLLDEPTAALDVSNVRKVEEVILAYRERMDVAVVWVSHSPEQIERVADRHLQLWGAK